MYWDLQMTWCYVLFYWARTTECARKTKCRANPFLGRLGSWLHLALPWFSACHQLSFAKTKICMVCRFAPVWSLLQWTVCTEEQRCPSIHWCSLVTHILRNISTSLVDNNAGDQYKSIIGFSSCKIRYTKVTIFLNSWPLTNGVLGLHAKEKGGGEVMDFVHAGLVLLAAWMKYFKME